jgi:hypothetical protein
MLFKYPLTDSQYARFQHANNNSQIQALGRKAGVVVTDEKIVGGIETMYFKGRCNGTMALVPVDGRYECWIQVRSKPWWLPWFVLDWGFKEALK